MSQWLTNFTFKFSQHVRTRCGGKNFGLWIFVVGIFNRYRFANTFGELFLGITRFFEGSMSIGNTHTPNCEKNVKNIFKNDLFYSTQKRL